MALALRKKRDMMSVARANLYLDSPFFASLAMRLRMMPDERVSMAAVNGKTFIYNPAAVNKLSLAQAKYLLAHEVTHCMLQHHTRRGTRNSKKWNVAADYAVEEMLSHTNIGEWIEGGVKMPPHFAGQGAEKIFAQMPDDEGQGQGPGDQGGAPDGSAGGGQPPPPGPTDATGTVEDFPGDTPDAQQENADYWQAATRQAAKEARDVGKLPGGLEKFVEELLNPLVPWRHVMRRFVTTTADEPSWLPPNRRYVYRNLYLPSNRGEGMPEIVMAVDTSGSVRDEELDQFVTEINSYLEDFPRSQVHVVQCDAKVHRADHFTGDDVPIKMAVQGRGGTQFQPVFDWVEENGLEPRCLVYLTDLEPSDTPREPPYPVLWISVKEHEAPFGEVVLLPRD